MLARAAVAVLLLIVPLSAFAEGKPVSGRGYFTGCDAEGDPIYCYIGAVGFSYAVGEDGGSAPGLFDALSALPLMGAVRFEGQVEDTGETSSDLVLTKMEPVSADPFEATLRALQGDWRSADGSQQVSVIGLDWLDYKDGEMSDSFQIAPGTACADGVDQGGMVLSLKRYDGDRPEDVCWRIKAADDGHLVVQDVATGTEHAFTRMLDEDGQTGEGQTDEGQTDEGAAN